MEKLATLDIDLSRSTISLFFNGAKDPIEIYFDTPARRFYLSLIAFVVVQMKQKDKPDYIHIRKHEGMLERMDNCLAGKNASISGEARWHKIRKAWRYTLPDLEAGLNFKVSNRNLIVPYEKGGKYRYECLEEECDIWSSLFQYDEDNTWRFKFAVDAVGLTLNDVRVTFNTLLDGDAWIHFLRQLEKETPADPSTEKKSGKDKSTNFSIRKYRSFARITARPLYLYALMTIIVIIVFVIGASLMIRKHQATSPFDNMDERSKPTIAILPFVNLSENSSQEYIADSITENIISALSKLPQLFVISRTSVFIYKDKPTNIQEVSKELGVRYILEGSSQVSGDKIRVTAQLVDAVKDYHIWSGRYDRNLEGILTLQDEITMQVITELQVKLTEGEKIRIWTKGTKNLEAQLEFIQGTYHFFGFNPDDLLQAKIKFEKAISLDPGYSEAYGFLSFVYYVSIHAGRVESNEKAQRKIYQNAKTALELDESSVMGYIGMGSYYLSQEQYDKCVDYMKQAATLYPNNSMAVRVYGLSLMVSGYPEKAIPFFKRSLQLDPKVPTQSYMVLGEAYRMLGEYETAILYLKKSLNDTPNHVFCLLNLAACYIGAGRTQEAKKTAKKILEINPNINAETFIKRLEHKNKGELKRFSEQLLKAGIPLKHR